VHNIKTVGKSGQISLGKAMAGMGFIVQELPGGDIVLKRAVVVPMNERLLALRYMQNWKRLANGVEATPRKQLIWLHLVPNSESRNKGVKPIEGRLLTNRGFRALKPSLNGWRGIGRAGRSRLSSLSSRTVFGYPSLLPATTAHRRLTAQWRNRSV
jgi:hypothetical protein